MAGRLREFSEERACKNNALWNQAWS